MSQIIATYDPSAKPSGTFVTNYLSNGIGSIVAWNDSDWSQDYTFPNGDTDIAPAWTAVKFLLQGPNGQVQWAQDTQLMSVNAAPISQVKVVAYRADEPVPGVYPVALVRQTTTANVVNTVGGTANAVQNDANPAGTSVVEATVSGDSSSAVSLVNDGRLLLGTTANDGFLQVTTAAGAHKLLFDTTGNLTIDKGILANLITAITGNDIGFHAATGQRVVGTINSINIFSINGDGIHLLTGSIFLTQPSVQNLSNGSTITIPGAMIQVGCAAAVTGIIMTAGSSAGQLVYLYNQGPNILTFAGSGSNVRQGSNIVVGNGKLLVMLWDGTNWATTGPV